MDDEKALTETLQLLLEESRHQGSPAHHCPAKSFSEEKLLEAVYMLLN